PATPVARDTRPPVAGPIERYLRCLSSLGPPRGSSSSARVNWSQPVSMHARSKTGRRDERMAVSILREILGAYRERENSAEKSRLAVASRGGEQPTLGTEYSVESTEFPVQPPQSSVLGSVPPVPARPASHGF